jgi:anaerobic selenocysteine-containing dehydrogenase
VRGACPHDCPDTCAWNVEVQDGRAVKLTGDKEHPFTRGGLCAKVNGYLADRTYNPDRVLHPLRRVGPKGAGEFERVSWEEALAGIAAGLRGAIDAHGPESVLPFNYAGTQGMVQCMSLPNRFFAALGASQLEATVCGDNGAYGLVQTQRIRVGADPESIADARFIVLWGTNTVVTNLHLWPFVQRARKQGARVVVIDPVRTRTAQAADWHVAPRPGTDAVLAYALMQVIVAEGLHDAAFVESDCEGFDELCAQVAPYPPERAAGITGVPAEEIVALARAYATTRPAVIRTLVGMEHRRHGATTFRAVSCLPALTGAWRERGGGLIGFVGAHSRTALPGMQRLPALDGVQPTARSVNMMQIGRALTDPALNPPLKALIVFNANPAATSPNQNLVLGGLAREDLLTVVHEHFLTDTARYADYVLPATTQVEHLDLMYSWGTLYVALNVPAIEPLGEAVPNTELFRRLARAMGLEHPGLYESDEQIIRSVLDSDHPWAEGITYERLLDEGWAKLRQPEGWRPEGPFDLALEPLPDGPAPSEDFPLALIAAKGAHHFLNSSYGGVERHLRAEREPVLDIGPADAAARGIADGDLVRVFNQRGELLARARVGDRVKAGLVAMPSGWWASRSPGGRSANVLTPDGISPLGRGGDFHDAFVDLAPVPAVVSGDLAAAGPAPAPTPR